MTILSTFGGTSGIDTGDIGHSLRFRGAQHLNRTFGAPTNNTSWAFSVRVKRGNLGSLQVILSAGALASISIDSTDHLVLYGNGGGVVATSTAVFRDPTGHYDMFFRSNGTNIKGYVIENGVSTEVVSYVGSITLINSASAHLIGWVSSSYYLSGYLSRICFVDNGGSLTHADFAQLNTEINEWVSKSQSAVKAVVDAGGTNSFMLDFDDATSLTTLGYDKSSKGNNWTLNNFSLTAGTTYDHMLDVPGNSYATLNPLDTAAQGSSITHSAGNLQIAYGTSAWRATPSSIVMTSGKWYAEADVTQGGAGTALLFGASTVSTLNNSANLGNWVGSIGIGKGTAGAIFAVEGSYPAAPHSIAANDRNLVAIDCDSGKAWLGYYDASVPSTTWYSSAAAATGDPVTGANPTMTFTPGTPIEFVHGIYATGTAYAAYFGASGFAATKPTGFLALCQANLPTPAILNPKNGFVAVTDTEANIDATLATARSGWTDFVDIKKNRAAAESWAWQFSHDSSNEYAISNATKTYQAKRAMSGANNWVGYSIRIGSLYGTAAGSVSHTNGVATTVTHNLGTAEQMVFLFPRAAGSVVPVFHPVLTAGSLLDLCGNAGQAASTAITSVGSSSFQIGSGQATGTYDYLVLSEKGGLANVFSWAGNSSADGPYADVEEKPVFAMFKNMSGVNQWVSYDTKRETTNVMQTILIPNSTSAEATTYHIDFLSRGIKPRAGAGFAMNDSGSTYVGIAFADVAGKYSLGR